MKIHVFTSPLLLVVLQEERFFPSFSYDRQHVYTLYIQEKTADERKKGGFYVKLPQHEVPDDAGFVGVVE
jgi:hypothetical protein